MSFLNYVNFSLSGGLVSSMLHMHLYLWSSPTTGDTIYNNLSINTWALGIAGEYSCCQRLRKFFECHHIRMRLSLRRIVRNVLRLHSHPYVGLLSPYLLEMPHRVVFACCRHRLAWMTRSIVGWSEEHVLGLNSIKPLHISECEMQATDQTQNIWRERDKRKHLRHSHISNSLIWSWER